MNDSKKDRGNKIKNYAKVSTKFSPSKEKKNKKSDTLKSSPQKQFSKLESKNDESINTEMLGLDESDEDSRSLEKQGTNFDEKTKIKLQRNLADLMAKDINKRTLLHRAALDQNHKLMEEVINDYEAIEKNYKNEKNQEDPQAVEIKPLKDFINTPDIFGNTPLLNACSLKIQGESKREDCLTLLLDHGANVNAKNKRTLWNALHWIAYHGEIESAKILVERKDPISMHEPDFQGYYAIDVAGKQNKNENFAVGSYIIENLYKKINDEHQEGGDLPEDLRFQSPMLKTSILFWAVKFGKESFVLKKICLWPNTFIESPMFLMHKMTAIHVAAQMAKDEALSELTSSAEVKRKMLRGRKNIQEKVKHLTNFSFNPEDNDIFPIKSNEVKIYDPKFVDKIKKFAKWVFNYEKDLFNEKSKILWIDEPDLYGNTPLHLASMSGHESCLKLLINLGCDPYKMNREGFRPQELIQNLKTKEALLQIEKSLSKKTEAQKEKEKELKAEIRKGIDKIIMKEKKARIKKTAIFSMKTNAVSETSTSNVTFSSIDEMLHNPIKTPEFVIRFHKKPEKRKKEDAESRLNDKDDINAGRLNFYISLLINANFEVYLAPSIDENFYYVMLSLDQKQLYKQCHNLKMRLKLIDSYNYEIYEQTKDEYTNKFEPLRSVQRQEIIFRKVKNILDLNMLKKEKLVKDYFMMHSLSGIARIRKKWITTPKWYWPQPLNQIDDYLIEGKSQNFQSLTFLKQYLGEKISFYFAWRSFSTCFMLPLAIPGLAFQIYILYYEEYHSQILPFWVFFVSLYTTVMVEFWKRKCSEINTRWGSLDLMSDDSWTKEFRTEFSGDECVNSVSQQITKVNTTKVTLLVFLISIPVLIVLLALCVLTYVLTKTYKNILGSTLSGLINGVVITLLNFIYTAIARWFVEKENHKYQTDHENSLISKSFTFRILNSFFTIFVVAFVDAESDFKDLFTTLWPILIYNKASNIGVQVLYPWLKYKYYQWKYFKQIKKKAEEQTESNGMRSKNKDQKGQVEPIDKDKKEEKDEILEFAKNNHLDYNNFWDRVVIFFHLGEKEKGSLRNIDLDQVELNSHRNEYLDTVDYYAEGFITFAYVTMFTAAFPIGPVIALVVDTVELKWKIFSFLFALKRPIVEKSTGIGIWMNVWEGMSIVTVPKVSFNVFYQADESHAYQNQELQRLWLVIILVAIILIVKFVFRALIPDKPKWVMDEEERQKAQKELFKGGEEIQNSLSKGENEHNEERNKKEIKLKKKIQFLQKELNSLNSKNQRPKEQSLYALPPSSQSQALPAISQLSNPQEFKAKTLSQFYKTFKFMEHELLIKRIDDVAKYEGNTLFLCNECHKSKAVLECLDCQEPFCKRCYKDVHLTAHAMIFGREAPPNIAYFTSENIQLENVLKENDNMLFGKITKNPKEKFKKETTKTTPTNKIKKASLKEKLNPQKFWKKFEYFCLPTFEKNSFYPSLIKIFNTFSRLYVNSNCLMGGTSVNQDLAVSDFQFEQLNKPNQEIKASSKEKQSNEFKGIDGNFLKIKNIHMIEILEDEDFNVEDKLFMNRLAFMGFRKLGYQFTVQDFLKYCKKLQDGKPFQKNVLFVRMMEFGDEIEREDVMDFMLPSLLRYVGKADFKGKDVILDLFAGETSLKKGKFWAEINNPKNSEFKAMMEAFMQIS